MKRNFPKHPRAGVSLMETVVAVGVLAIAVPLAFAAMTKATSVGSSARAETRAPAIAERCLLEVKAAQKGESAFLPPIEPAVSFPGEGDVMALGFSREGRILGVVAKEDFQAGLREKMGGEDVDYVARITGRFDDPELTLTVRVEYPAVKKEASRSGVGFHTKLP